MDNSIATSAGVAAPTRRVDQLLAHYGESHRNPVNELIHIVAVPLIMLSLLGLLQSIHPWVPLVVMALSLVYYARLSMVFLLSMLMMGLVMLAVVRAMGEAVLTWSVAIFVLAWIAQFIGHHIEGKKPSFFEDLQYLLVGPLFVLSVIYRRLGVRW